MKNNISFVIPAFNCSNTVEESVDSIFNGNFSDGDEVTIVNDGSTDNTIDILRKLEKKYYPNIYIIDNHINIGCPASRNIGIKNAKNDLIFNLDSDNVLAGASILNLKKALIDNNADIVAFQEYWYFKKNKKNITHKWICCAGWFQLPDIFVGFFNPASGGNFLYRKDFWVKIGGYWEYGKGLHEAWGFSLKSLLNGAKFFVVPKSYYFHRYSHESLFIRENKKKDEAVNITNKFIEQALGLLNENSLEYVRNNPGWFDHLFEKPLVLKDGVAGKNGKMVYSNKIKNFLYFIKKIIKK